MSDGGNSTPLRFKVIEVLSPGIALCSESICFLGEPELTGTRLEKLPAKKRYPPTQKAELMTQVLPEMDRRRRLFFLGLP